MLQIYLISCVCSSRVDARPLQVARLLSTVFERYTCLLPHIRRSSQGRMRLYCSHISKALLRYVIAIFLHVRGYEQKILQPEEQMTCDVLLRIFRTSLPFMPKTAAKFGQELQTALQPLLLKPSNTAGSQVPSHTHGLLALTNGKLLLYRGCKKLLHACAPSCITLRMTTRVSLGSYGHVTV